jgi:hypothetical protein
MEERPAIDCRVYCFKKPIQRRTGYILRVLHARDNRPGRRCRACGFVRPQAIIRCLAAFTGRRPAGDFRRYQHRKTRSPGMAHFLNRDAFDGQLADQQGALMAAVR